MRNVVITREKSSVACLAKMKVYIEDPISGDVSIKMRVRDDATGQPVTKQVMCRQLGVLKNGEQATFPIGLGAAKIVVIADKMSRNYCNEYYQIPAGEEDVVLSGKNKYHPFLGNPFRFNGVADDMVLQNRKRNTKIGILVLCLSLVIGVAIGLASVFIEDASPKTFSDEGITMTLTGEFEQLDFEEYTVCYGSSDVAVFVIRDDFELMPGGSALSLNQYAHLVMNSTGVSSEVKTSGDLTYFGYEGSDDGSGEVFYYYTFAYKSSNAYWVVQYAMDKNQAEDYREQVFAWAESVKFN